VKLRTSASHEEGCERRWGILTKEFIGAGEKLVKLTTVDVEFVINGQGRTDTREVPDSVREWPADLVLLAMGFTGPETDAIVDRWGLKLDERGSIQTDNNYMSTVPGVFAAGDANRGQSLIVCAISEGREAARCVDAYLMGASVLPRRFDHNLKVLGSTFRVQPCRRPKKRPVKSRERNYIFVINRVVS